MLYEVTGVVHPFPDNAHFHFDYLAAMAGYPDSKVPFWLSNNYYTYLKLKHGTDEKDFNNKLTRLFSENASPQLIKFFNITADDFAKAGNRSNYGVQKVTDIHLKSNLNFEIEANGNDIYVYIFILVAVFVLLNACINFTNLATARSSNRAKEVGLRKVLGSDRKSLIFQFLAESVMISYLAVLLAILMIELLLPHFNNLLNVSLQLRLTDYIRLVPFILLFATFVGLLSGAYPAFYLSSFNPNEVLKKKFYHGSSRNWLRNTLVTIQFIVSIVILLGTLLVASQLRFFQNKKMGFDKDRLLVIERTDPVKQNMKAFLEELQKCPAIESASLSSGVPGRENGEQGFTLEGRNSTDIFIINTYGANFDYAQTMGIKLKDGRFFSKEYATDSMAVVINEASARYLGLSDPVGKEIISSGQGSNALKLKIIGIMEDFHYESLHKPVNPLLLFLIPQYSE
jgi:putative ABC transport system permease protein